MIPIGSHFIFLLSHVVSSLLIVLRSVSKNFNDKAPSFPKLHSYVLLLPPLVHFICDSNYWYKGNWEAGNEAEV